MGNVGPGIAYKHLLSVTNTLLERVSDTRVIRILDVGCGDGGLIAFLIEHLSKFRPSRIFEVVGLDVHDFGVEFDESLGKTIEFLSAKFPDVSWSERISAISVFDEWPYPDEYFDFIVSNHVIEHVEDHAFFFSQVRRTLREGGFSVHLFPLQECVYEAHLRLPIAHWIKNHDLLRAYIKWLSWCGLGKFKAKSKGLFAKCSLDMYAEQRADFLLHFTNYIRYSDVVTLAKQHHLRITFSYTWQFYWQKMRTIVGLGGSYKYSNCTSAVMNWLAIMLLRRLSSVTMILEKRETLRGKLYQRYRLPFAVGCTKHAGSIDR